MAGRVMARRFMGKLAFMSLTDDSGSVQIYLDRAVLEEGEPDAFKCAAGGAQGQHCRSRLVPAAVAKHCGQLACCMLAAGGACSWWRCSS